MASGHDNSVRHVWLRAFWNMRWPAAIICGPVLGLCLIALFFGLPGHLWYLGLGFFVFSLTLYAMLVRGEALRLQQRTGGRS